MSKILQGHPLHAPGKTHRAKTAQDSANIFIYTEISKIILSDGSGSGQRHAQEYPEGNVPPQKKPVLHLQNFFLNFVKIDTILRT